VNMRAVAQEAGVSLGLVNYHYTDKAGLIAAALHRIGEQDLALLETRRGATAEANLRAVIRRVAEPEFLTTEYLSLRLQLWSLAQVNTEFARINADAQEDYRKGLAELISAARPALPPRECARRAADIDVIQNGVWLTTLLGLDRASARRNIERCEEIALAD
jgi:TetR/AcrR family transcriptional regulator, cholesterol catabolism regulator